MLTTLLLSQGVPMISAGDECRRTQHGNNNAYCQDNAVSWFDWSLLKANAGLLRFCRSLIAFRRDQPSVRRTTFLSGRSPGPGTLADVSWFAPSGRPVDWLRDEHSLTCLLSAPAAGPEFSLDARHLLIFMHAGTAPRRFEIPPPAKGIRWRKFIDTSAACPKDIFPDLDGPVRRSDRGIKLMERSIVCFVSPRQGRISPLSEKTRERGNGEQV
jgi:glycogen operon protein